MVAPPSRKQWQLEVVVPVEDMSDIAASAAKSGDDGPGGYDRPDAYDRPAGYDQPSGSDIRERASIWPHVEEQIVDLVEQHRSTIVFANSRRLAERLTARLNEISAERRGELPPRRRRRRPRSWPRAAPPEGSPACSPVRTTAR